MVYPQCLGCYPLAVYVSLVISRGWDVSLSSYPFFWPFDEYEFAGCSIYPFREWPQMHYNQTTCLNCFVTLTRPFFPDVVFCFAAAYNIFHNVFNIIARRSLFLERKIYLHLTETIMTTGADVVYWHRQHREDEWLKIQINSSQNMEEQDAVKAFLYENTSTEKLPVKLEVIN